MKSFRIYRSTLNFSLFLRCNFVCSCVDKIQITVRLNVAWHDLIGWLTSHFWRALLKISNSESAKQIGSICTFISWAHTISPPQTRKIYVIKFYCDVMMISWPMKNLTKIDIFRHCFFFVSKKKSVPMIMKWHWVWCASLNSIMDFALEQTY